ncbi:methyltransferase family protein [Burkholderiales bacterium JOSHI_001]|nr:methyltransferase family protein [Burkholderiales bacterium JOSHI_001]
MHTALAPSDWLTRWAHLLPAGGTVLDVACGSGRHVRWLAERGFSVTALDRDAAALAPLAGLAEVVVADIEAAAWPLPGRHFDAVLVTNYLHRPLLPTLLASLAEHGVLLYETFAHGNQSVGRPSRPDFLLQPGELLAATAGLRVVAYEDGFADAPARFIQRVVAVREPPADPPARHRLLPV